MHKFRQPMHPVVQNTLILLTSGLVASVLCAKVYGATLPVEEPVVPTVTVATATPAPVQTQANNDAAAAAQLRAMLRGQPVLLGQAAAPVRQ